MNAEYTASDRRDLRAGELRAEMDARLVASRQRPLPAWLASRGNRRAVALLPLLPLAAGLFAGTLEDSILRSALLAAVAALLVAAILLLRWATRLLDAVPDRLLDEREIGQRDAAYKAAHPVVVALLTLLVLVGIADGTAMKLTGLPLVPGDGWLPITLTAMLVSTTVPAAVLAWRWVDPPADGADDD